MLKPVLTSAPAEDLVTLAEAKAHCHVEFSDDDALLTGLVAAATRRLDGYSGILGRCLVTQSWRVDMSDWPRADVLRLPFPDVSTITSVKYFDADNAEQTVSSGLYELQADARGSFIRFRDEFTAPEVYDDRLDAVKVIFVAGYGAASAVPAPIRTAALMMVAHWYANREAAASGEMHEIPLGVTALTEPYRHGRI